MQALAMALKRYWTPKKLYYFISNLFFLVECDAINITISHLVAFVVGELVLWVDI